MPLYTNKTLPTQQSDWKTVPTAEASELSKHRYSATALARNRAKAKLKRKKKKEKRYGAALEQLGEAHEYQAVTREGLGARFGETPAEWRTKITWNPADPETKDGTGVTATCLGPDHKQGTPPADDAGGHAVTLKHETGYTYLKGHLLNHNVGGPGDDNRNLTAITSSANSLMKDAVEEPIKRLVNDQKGWVYFKVNVQHDRDKSLGVRYASKLTFDWHQLMADDQDQPTKVPGTEASKTLDEPSPSKMQERMDSGRKKAHGDERAKITPGGDPMGCQQHPRAAVAPLEGSSIILLPETAAIERLKQRLDENEGDHLEEGRDDAKAIADILCRLLAPRSTPKTRWLERQIQARSAELPKLATSVENELEKPAALAELRRDAQRKVLKPLQAFMLKKDPAKADKRMASIKLALESPAPTDAHEHIVNALIERDRAQDDAVYLRESQLRKMAPRKRAHAQLERGRRSARAASGKRRRRERSRERQAAPTPAAQMAGALIQIRRSGLDWTKAAADLADIDPDLHQLVILLVQGTFDSEFLERSFEGHSRSNPNFPAYLQQTRDLFASRGAPGSSGPM